MIANARRWIRHQIDLIYCDEIEPVKKKLGKWADGRLNEAARRIIKSRFIQKRVTLNVPDGKVFTSREVLRLDGLFLKSSGFSWCSAQDVIKEGVLHAPFIEMQKASKREIS